MFYSHQILARKGPLATVWMAAHLQHRLKKPHYNSVDINSTIDKIIWPDAPIALRMSGHLLLGVVRIYSKKVDYLFNDCNEIMAKVSKAFTPTEANVTEAPASAPVDEVTLPERYELDALELNDNLFTERGADDYMRSPEDITLPDSTPINMDHYVAITFEDFDMTPIRSSFRGLDVDQETVMPQPAAAADRTDSSGGAGPGNETELASEGLHRESSSGFQPMEEDFLHVPPVHISEHVQKETTTQRIDERQSPQSIEVMRHAIPDSSLPDIALPYQTRDEVEQQPADVSGKEREFVSPVAEELLDSGEQPPSFPLQTEQMDAAIMEETPNLFGSHLSFSQASVEFAIRSTPSAPQVHVPPIEVAPAPRRSKKKLYDEKAIVLSNKALKDALKDTSKIVRKKRRLPDSFIGSWRLEKLVRKEFFFAGPLLTGMCEDLHNICMDLSEKPYLASEDEPMQEAGVHVTPEVVLQPHVSQGIAAQHTESESEGDLNIQTDQATPAPDRAEQSPTNTSNHGSARREKVNEDLVFPTELDMEIERLRQHEGDVGTSMMPEFTPATAVLLSPTKGDDRPAVSAGSFRSGQEGQSIFGPGLFPTPDIASSAETLGPEPEPEAVATSELHQLSFSGVPEILKSPGTDELHFLDADSTISGTPIRGSKDASLLSVRTRGTAQYLKNKFSPSTPSSGDEAVIFSLNDILQDQPRKRCARMFYETLVLKSSDLIDVAQNESYGDITLRLTPALKAQL